MKKFCQWMRGVAVGLVVVVAAGPSAGQFFKGGDPLDLKHFPESERQLKRLQPELKRFLETYRKEVANCAKSAACTISVKPSSVYPEILSTQREMREALADTCKQCLAGSKKLEQCLLSISDPKIERPSCP